MMMEMMIMMDYDAIINTIDGDDEDEDGDPDQIEIVPRLKTVTRHGRIAGTWQRRFQLSHDTSSDSDPDNDTPEPGPHKKNPTNQPQPLVNGPELQDLHYKDLSLLMIVTQKVTPLRNTHKQNPQSNQSP